MHLAGFPDLPVAHPFSSLQSDLLQHRLGLTVLFTTFRELSSSTYWSTRHLTKPSKNMCSVGKKKRLGSKIEKISMHVGSLTPINFMYSYICTFAIRNTCGFIHHTPDCSSASVYFLSETGPRVTFILRQGHWGIWENRKIKGQLGAIRIPVSSSKCGCSFASPPMMVVTPDTHASPL